MTYSAAWFAPVDPAGFDGLEPAQRRRSTACSTTPASGPALGPRIGSGGPARDPGGAQGSGRPYDHVVGPSARPRPRTVRPGGVADRVRIDLRDYRDVQGTYDAVVSVEMIEAVGYDYWRDYFAALARATAPEAPSPSRRSRWRMTGCSPRGMRMAGSRSTSSRRLIPSVEAIDRHAAAAARRHREPVPEGGLRAHLRLWARPLRRSAAPRPRPRLRPDLPSAWWEFYLAYSRRASALATSTCVNAVRAPRALGWHPVYTIKQAERTGIPAATFACLGAAVCRAPAPAGPPAVIGSYDDAHP